MSVKSMKHRLAVVLFVFFWVVPVIVSPALAESEAEFPPPTISFVQEGELVFGPPLPSTVDFVINIKDIGNTNADLKIQVIHLTDEKGNGLPPAFIQAILCEHAEKKVQTNLKDQVLTRRICLDTTHLEWGTYTALLQATLGNLAQATKFIKLVVGPEIPVAILNSEITVLGTACPKVARTEILKEMLCPNFGTYDVYTAEGTNLISIAGYSEKDSVQFKKFFESASGTLVSIDGAGTIFARLERWAKQEDFTACRPEMDKTICSKVRLRFWGVFKAGTYTGTFYLNTDDQSNDATKVQITFKAKDYWRLPSLIILLGLLVSAWVTWRLGPRKENINRAKADRAIVEKRDYLEGSLQEFRSLVRNEKPAYFVEDPDILAEVEFLLYESINESKKKLETVSLNELTQQMDRVVPLFIRFCSFYQVLYELHVWEETHHAKLGKDDLRKEIDKTRQQMWTADTEEKMDSAQDALTQALLIAQDFYRNNKNKLRLKAPPMFKVVPPVIPETTSTTSKTQPQKPNSQIGDKLEKIIQWSLVLLSGIYVVYVTNPTFGTPQDYIYAFLWGSATNAGIEFVTKFLGANTSIMSVISGLTK